jgi:hypothetical protein
MLTTPFKAKSMKELYQKVKKGEYPPIPNNFSPKFQIIIDSILKVKPEERPDASDILNMPEIVDKIEELNIFEKEYTKKKNMKKNIFQTNYKINDRLDYLKQTGFSSRESSKNYNKDNILIKKLKSRIDNYKNIGKKSRLMNVNKSVELRNNINYKLNKKYEILNIYKQNLSYFLNKYNQKMKVVIKTIKYPTKFKCLQNNLPGVRYDDDSKIISKENSESTSSKNCLNVNFPIHKFLPKIKNNKIQIKKKIQNENAKNDINDENSKINEIKEILDKKNYLVMNTLQHQINNENLFNSKGKINITIKG